MMRCLARLLMIMVSLELSGKVRKALSLPRFFTPPRDFQREERKNRRMKQKKIVSHICSVRNPEFKIWDFALASSYNGKIWDLQAKLGLFLGPKFGTLFVN